MVRRVDTVRTWLICPNAAYLISCTKRIFLRVWSNGSCANAGEKTQLRNWNGVILNNNNNNVAKCYANYERKPLWRIRHDALGKWSVNITFFIKASASTIFSYIFLHTYYFYYTKVSFRKFTLHYFITVLLKIEPVNYDPRTYLNLEDKYSLKHKRVLIL